jgi:heterodisulfide reductase subunit B
MKLKYYPGCSLKSFDREFEISAISSLDALGIKLEEIPRWNCCGTVHSLTKDDLMHHLASVRNLIRVQEHGSSEDNKVITLCAMCYNTLKRTNLFVRENPDSLKAINSFLDEEEDYKGEVEVLHLLDVLKDMSERIKEKVAKPLSLKIAPFYGCLLLRPREVGLDDPERPHILEDLIEALGASVIDSPYKTQCCGSYHIAFDKEIVTRRVSKIVSSVLNADLIVTSCPLCNFNLQSQAPVLHFTQLMAAAFGRENTKLRF